MPNKRAEQILGYVTIAFENGIGNIIPPTVEKWIPANGKD